MSCYEYDQPETLVVIGDLNGDYFALECILRGLNLINSSNQWVGKNTHVIQVGDVVNRGNHTRDALDLLMRLHQEARDSDCMVDMLLGNHEVMVTLADYAWCHAQEFLDFATPQEIMEYELARTNHMHMLLQAHSTPSEVRPIVGSLRAWEDEHAPGRTAYKDAMGPDGTYGQFLRTRPVALKIGPIILSHAGLIPSYCRQGLDALHAVFESEWSNKPRVISDLHYQSPLFDESGPLWNRRFATDKSPASRQMLKETLELLAAKIMVVGHTRTDVLGGAPGLPLALHDGQLICVDVGLGHQLGSPAALIIQGQKVYSWRPETGRLYLSPIGDS